MLRIFKYIIIISGISIIVSVAMTYLYPKFIKEEGVFGTAHKKEITFDNISANIKEKSTTADVKSKTLKGPGWKEKQGSTGSSTKTADLIKKLTSNDFKESQLAAGQLRSLGSNSVEGLLVALKDADIALKGQIIFLLGMIADKRAVPGLIQCLKDDNAYIRRNATESLGRIGDEKALGHILPMINDRDAAVRERVCWAMKKYKGSSVSDALMIRLEREKEERVKVAIIETLAETRQTTATPILLQELHSDTNNIRFKNIVVKALGECGSSDAILVLTQYLEGLKKYTPNNENERLFIQESCRIAEETIAKITKNNSMVQ
jgi:HEAT repeat protein